jgi:hypothetical protein
MRKVRRKEKEEGYEGKKGGMGGGHEGEDKGRGMGDKMVQRRQDWSYSRWGGGGGGGVGVHNTFYASTCLSDRVDTSMDSFILNSYP